MLVLTRKNAEKLQIGQDISVTILRIKGRSVQIGIEAPQGVVVVRTELLNQATPSPAFDTGVRPAASVGCIASEESVGELRQSRRGRRLVLEAKS
jgi:carbon storage regulator